jgi:SAM-dependent methyltransferase
VDDDLFDRPAAWRFAAATALGLRGSDLIAGLVTGAGYPDALVPVTARFARGDGPVADLGAGLGAATTWIGETAGVRVLGVEPEPRAAALAMRAFPGLPVVAGTATAPPLRSGACRGVALLGVVSLLDELEPVLAAAKRLLHAGGVLAISDLCATDADGLRPTDSPNVFRSREQLAAAMDASGFVVEDIWSAPASQGTEWDDVGAAVDDAIERRHGHTELYAEWRADRDRMGRLIGAGELEVATLTATAPADRAG